MRFRGASKRRGRAIGPAEGRPEGAELAALVCETGEQMLVDLECVIDCPPHGGGRGGSPVALFLAHATATLTHQVARLRAPLAAAGSGAFQTYLRAADPEAFVGSRPIS